NYGTLSTNYQLARNGTVGGIVGYVREPVNGHTYNIISCENHGFVNYFTSKGANDCAGILAEVNTQGSSEQIYINVIDCINGSDATVYAYSMADGIVSWIGGDNTEKTAVHIDRCRNYSSNLLTRNNTGSGVPNSRGRTGGIYGTSTTPGSDYGYVCITNCFSVTLNASNTGTTNDTGGYPISFAQEGTGTGALKDCANNYYMDSISFESARAINDFDSRINTGAYISGAILQYTDQSGDAQSKGINDALTNNTLKNAFDGSTSTYAAQDYLLNSEATIIITLSEETYIDSVDVTAWASNSTDKSETISVSGSSTGAQTFTSTTTNSYELAQSVSSIEVVVNSGTKEHGGDRFTIYEIDLLLSDGSELVFSSDLDYGEQYGADYLGATRLFNGYSATATTSQAQYGNYFAALVSDTEVPCYVLSTNGYSINETSGGNDVIRDASQNTAASIMFRYSGSDAVIDDVFKQYLDYIDSLGWQAPINVDINKTASDDDETIGSYKVTWDDPNVNPSASSYIVTLYVYEASLNDTVSYSNGVLYDSSGNALSVAETITDTVYNKSASFNITDSDSINTLTNDYYVLAKVVAVGSSEQSDEGVSGYIKLQPSLLSPELEVVRVNSKWYIRLANADEYEEMYMDSEGNWLLDFYIKAVIVYTNSTSEYEINVTDGKVKISGDYYDYCAVNSSGSLVSFNDITNRPLRGTAVPQDDDVSNYIRSTVFSSNIYVPNGIYPSGMSLTVDESASNGYGFAGSSSNDLTYTAAVTLTTTAAYSQIYRAELLADAGDGNGYQTTVATKDIALSSGTQTILEFNNISSDVLEKYEGFKVALYYASSGLGPVYTYREITDEDDITTVSAYTTPRNYGYDKVYVSEDETEYYYADPLYVNSGSASTPDYWIGDSTATFTAAPVLEDIECLIGIYDGTTFTENEEGSLLYHFAWDKDVTTEYDYEVVMYGIKDGTKTLIDTSYDSETFMGRNGDSDKDFYLNADEYAYDEIYIKVTTLVSNSDTNTITIGKSSNETTTVKKRLSQPLAINYAATDIDELLYSFNWSAYTDEDEIEACAGYKLMISYVNESAETVKEQ
ncbi:MAG: hypothetical protein K6A23_09475, partial [Butyrivibrio sp.]|nr:hypothetical protein [Butyrivibrio sp.]